MCVCYISAVSRSYTSVCVYVSLVCNFVIIYKCVYVFVLCPLLFPYREGRTRALSSACKTNRADSTDWMPFLPSNFIEEISFNTEALDANT